MEQKLVVVIMGQNCEKFLPMCLGSVGDADTIVFCDGGSIDTTLSKLDGRGYYMDKYITDKKKLIEWGRTVIENKYNQEDPMMNGKQRNFYLKYLKENYPNDWALCLDADEVVEDLDKIKEMIQQHPGGLWSVKMRHFQEDLGHEDATQQTHYVLNRLFKISDADKYPEVEHPVLQGIVAGQTDCTTIWHLAHITHCFNIKNRYEKNMKHSNIHSPEFLDWWKDSHMFGTYPSKQVNPTEIPDIILNYFHIDKDKYYFANRGIEIKHFIDVIKYKEFFKL
jgi:hypothetical protein